MIAHSRRWPERYTLSTECLVPSWYAQISARSWLSMPARAYTGRARAYMPLDPTRRGAVARRMHFGVVMFPTDYAMRVDDLARAVEARGFESLWFPEHTHIPTSRRSPWPGGPTLPKEYSHTHDLFVALAMAAAVTTRIRIGSGILLGGHGPRALRRVVDYCDGWLPIGVRAGDLAAGLEDAGAATRETGWHPRHLTVWDGDRLVAAAPLYVKDHSLGEFVFDQGWASAALRARIPYFPKLLAAVPFTPVTGARLLTAPD